MYRKREMEREREREKESAVWLPLSRMKNGGDKKETLDLGTYQASLPHLRLALLFVRKAHRGGSPQLQQSIAVLPSHPSIASRVG